MNWTNKAGEFIQGTPFEKPADALYHALVGPQPRTISVEGGPKANVLTYSSGEYNSAPTLGGERPVITEFLRELQPEDIVWDIGAYTGWWAVLVGQSAPTIAFEPHPDAYDKLVRNLSRNPNADVLPVRSAIGDESGVATLQPAGQQSVLKTEEKGGTKVSVHTGASLTEHLVKPTACKIDVEGAELAVLDGFDHLLTDIRLLAVECHGEDLSVAVKEQLIEEGFTVVKKVDTTAKNILFSR